ncbi:hypothetical protein [Terasakiella pusilla]|uniref:hypothetical protein n=1 Tax=Terasakiella pusilla TaxID=64973 RepID=UPI003AA94FF0
MNKSQLVNDMMAQFKKEGQSVKWQLTDPQNWSPEDLQEVMKHRNQTNDRAEKEALFQKERQWFDQNFGTNPVTFDETGRMVMPKSERVGPSRSMMPVTPEGDTLPDALQEVIYRMVGENGDQAARDVVKTLQGGVNRLSPKRPLKEDGVIGPKTTLGMGAALKENGLKKVSEAMALSQFAGSLPKQRATGAQGLGQAVSQAFSGLLGGQAEALGLQGTLNDFGAQLKEDGDIGPKTKSAFLEVLNKQNPADLLERLGYNLGFSSADEMSEKKNKIGK